jgi:hypothetical protein
VTPGSVGAGSQAWRWRAQDAPYDEAGIRPGESPWGTTRRTKAVAAVSVRFRCLTSAHRKRYSRTMAAPWWSAGSCSEVLRC